jgi:para-aminobenzoate synthetase component 1
MREIDIGADDLVAKLLALAATETVCILDSAGVSHLGSHLLIAGVRPVDIHEVSEADPDAALLILDREFGRQGLAGVFTMSYEFGAKMHSIASQNSDDNTEPDAFLALFDNLIVHDYNTGKTFLAGDERKFVRTEDLITGAARFSPGNSGAASGARSNFSREEYIAAVECIKEQIRAGLTYQTNLTQQLTVKLRGNQTPENIFANLRKSHPAPFGSFINRQSSTVVSASPERFFRVTANKITASPIKGTRPRGSTSGHDNRLRSELLSSAKDRAENTMIVDLMRNDLGRICEFGSVKVERLCELEVHPTLFHLVSTVTGSLRKKLPHSAIIKALFPSGSITGAPKLSTMRIIASIEKSPRGLSMGSVGINIPSGFPGLTPVFEMNVAIRTMVIRGNEAVFNVGGGVVIDSDPSNEYDEALLKARALLAAAGAPEALDTSS